MRLPSAIKFIVGLAVAAALMVWVLRGTDPAAVAETVSGAWLPGLAVAAALNLGHNVFRVWRWRALLEPATRHVPFWPMVEAVLLGYLVSWTVPGRMGELVRPAVLSARADVPLGASLGSVLADRVLDALSVVLLFGVGMMLTPLEGGLADEAARIRGASLLLVALISVPLGGLLVVAAFRERLARRVGVRRGLVAWVVRAVLAFSAGTEALRRPRLLAGIAFHSLAAWGVIALALWIGVRACGAEIPFGAMLVILPLLVLGIAIPTPGGAGGYHWAVTAGLTLFGVARPVAVGAAFVLHALVVLPVIVVGLLVLLGGGLSWRELIDAAKRLRALGAAEPAAAGAVPGGRIR